jgi:hypothetical protein
MFAAAEVRVGEIDDWRPSPGQVRDALLEYRITVTDMRHQVALPPNALASFPTEAEVEAVALAAYAAAAAGRFISFGHWSNEAIKRGSKRAGPLWNQGALPQPFGGPWIFMHSWDAAEADGQAVSVYLVLPRPPEVWACELVPVRYSNVPMLELGDRALLHPPLEPTARSYHTTVAPGTARWAMAVKLETGDPSEAAAANVIDPMMLALMMLNTRGVERRTVAPNEKLARARARRGKAAIPPYDEVFSALYITALTLDAARRPRSADAGGSHRSPTPHIRRGHPRDYANGIRVLIQDTLVNVPPEQRAQWKMGRRSHYEVRDRAP